MLRITRARFVLLACAVACFCPLHAADDVDIRPDVVYGHDYGMALTFDVLTPKNPNGAGILFMVSGGWVSRWFPPQNGITWHKALLDKGFTVFLVRHGSSPKFVVPEAIEHVRRSVRYIRLHADDFGVDPERLGAYGFSAGGHLSLMLGTASDAGTPGAKDPVLTVTDRVAAVVAFFPPTDLRGLIIRRDKEGNLVGKYKAFPALAFDAAKAPDCSPLDHVSPDDPPTLLIHGDKDKLVPIKHATRIQHAFEKNKVASELIVIKGAAHGFMGGDLARAVRASVEWFEKHLCPEAKPGDAK